MGEIQEALAYMYRFNRREENDERKITDMITELRKIETPEDCHRKITNNRLDKIERELFRMRIRQDDMYNRIIKIEDMCQDISARLGVVPATGVIRGV